MKNLFFLLLCLASLPCYSQNSPQKKPERICRVIYLERPADAPTEAHLFDGVQSHKIELSSMNFSLPVTLPEGDLTVGLTPNPVIDPENFPVGAPTIKVPARIRDLYIVLGKDEQNKVFPVRMQPVDVSDDQLKIGQTLWVNLTTHNIEGKLGSDVIKIDPAARVISKAPLASSGYFEATFVYQANNKGPYLPVQKKSWWHDPNSKNLGFIIDTGERVPRIFSFKDQREPKATAPN